ncbi:MAG: hypothetical protein CVU57_09805 [Deltaproteobacteria bacterium HGW-Deltaproteobacteria-15]|jgi:hypothetical protein|nr:MAG: hypothetical protein CVU57_09805 [Deltaproteobacteria bacterium HGW-Deltaproteobacteria-15]
MPLGFPSLSHGTIAFGFFNIDTDLLLLDHYFIFADHFCSNVARLAREGDQEASEETWDVYAIENRSEIGDLMGAIHSIRFSGFIGEVYRRFPFPQNQSEFKQKPEGYRNRGLIAEIIGRYGVEVRISIKAARTPSTVQIGEFLFSAGVFQELVQYVWLGGYPRWRDGIRPDYVLDMKQAVEESRSWLFSDIGNKLL